MSMTRQQVADLMQKVFEELHAAREAGQKEYAHDSDNAFGNFERLSNDLHIEREKVLWIFLKKHLDGILAHINGHQSQREDVRGRIKDAIVYLILLWAMVSDRELLANAVFPSTTREVSGIAKSFESYRQVEEGDGPLR